jgi:hypothetical protein
VSDSPTHYVQRYKDPYLGLQDGFVSSFFRDVLGVRTTTYNFGFRGINVTQIETFYGPGYSDVDFTRLNLYRDVSAYVEVARRAKLVCGDTTASIGDFISVDQWVAASNATAARRRLQGKDFESVEDRKRHLLENVPSLAEGKANKLAENHHNDAALDRRVAECAPDFTMSCLFEKVGTRFTDA